MSPALRCPAHVSGAAGAVGQTVGQLARIEGCRMVGIAGGAAQCEWVVEELGSGYLRDGRMKSMEDVASGGLDAFPQALDKLCEGTNFGKLVLQVATD